MFMKGNDYPRVALVDWLHQTPGHIFSYNRAHNMTSEFLLFFLWSISNGLIGLEKKEKSHLSFFHIYVLIYTYRVSQNHRVDYTKFT